MEHSLIQQYVPEEWLSRVYSLDMMGSLALMPLGYILAGFLAAVLGASRVLVGGGIAEIGLIVLLAGTVRELRALT